MISFRDLLAPGLIAKIDDTQGSVPLFSASQCHPSQSLMGRDTSIFGGPDKENVRPTATTSLARCTLETPFTAKTRPDQHSPELHEVRSTPQVVSPVHGTIFFTPIQSVSRVYGSVSPSINETPFKSLPKMEMLGLDFIQQCQDPSTLQDIIRVLSEVPGTPSLLRTAKSRYDSLCATMAMTNQTCERRLQVSNGSTTGLVASSSSRADSAAPSQPRNDSSLYFSIDSESDDSGEEEKGSTKKPSPQPVSQLLPSLKGDFPSLLLHLNENDNDVEIQSGLFRPQHERNHVLSSPLSNDRSLPDRLQSEVERLTQQVKNLETNQWHAQQDFAEQIESLEIDRRQTDQKLTALQEQLRDSVVSKQEILKRIDEMQLEQKRLNKVFLQHREDWLRQSQEPTVAQSKGGPSSNTVYTPCGISKPSTEPPIPSAEVTKTPKSALKKTPVSCAGGGVIPTNKRVTLNLYAPPMSPHVEEEPTDLQTPRHTTTPRTHSPNASIIKQQTTTKSTNRSANMPPSSTGTPSKEALMLKRQLVPRSGGLKALKEHYRRARSPRNAASPRLPLKALA